MKPEIIIFDEPTAMLDPEGRLEVMEIIKSLHQEGITVILITHFMEEAASADRIVIMSGGRIVLDDIPAEIFKSTEKIEELDLRLPFPIEIAARLRERGVAVPENVLTQEDLAGYVVDVAKGWIPGQARDDNSSSRDDNSSSRDDNSSSRDDNSSSRDDNSSSRDDNSSSRDDNSSSRDDNSSPRDDNSSPRDDNSSQGRRDVVARPSS
jgi:ABC-type multidrug transport system ATPase subunit